MNCELENVEVIKGSKVTFDLIFTDDKGGPPDLSAFVGNVSNVVFCNCAGTRFLIPFTLAAGETKKTIIISAASTLLFDEKSKDADVELNDGAEIEIILLADKFDIKARFCPPAV